MKVKVRLNDIIEIEFDGETELSQQDYKELKQIAKNRMKWL